MTAPKKEKDSAPMRSHEEDPWGVGQMDDGKIDIFPESELAERLAQRDADEAAFGALFPDEDQED